MVSCPLCSSLKVTVGQESKLYGCLRCDLVFKSRSLWPEQHEEKTRYDAHQNSLDDPAYVAMLEAFITAAVVPYVSPVGHGIDYGSGPAPVLSELLKRKGFAMNIYDPFYAPDPVPLLQSYDFITSTEVAEHVYRPVDMWNTFRKMLRPHGVVALSTNFHPGLQAACNWWYVRDITHVVFYSLATFGYVADTWGFDIVYTDKVKTIVLKVKS